MLCWHENISNSLQASIFRVGTVVTHSLAKEDQIIIVHIQTLPQVKNLFYEDVS